MAPPRVLLTRPAAQCAPLAALCAAQGWCAQVFAPLLLEADADALLALPSRLTDADWLIPVSPGAIDLMWPALPPLSPRLRLACVGRASAERLAALSGRAVLHPTQGHDSEALLALPALASLAGQKVVIVRGASGRALLAQTLAARGARVDACAVYRRVPCDPGWATLTPAEAAEVAAIVVTSSEIAQALFASAPPAWHAWLAAQIFVALHPRIGDALARLGAREVRLAAAANDAALLAALQGCLAG